MSGVGADFSAAPTAPSKVKMMIMLVTPSATMQMTPSLTGGPPISRLRWGGLPEGREHDRPQQVVRA